MTPQELVKFLLENDFKLVHNLKEMIVNLKPDDFKGELKEKYEKIGEFKTVDTSEIMDDNRPMENVVVHFKTLGFFIEERNYTDWDGGVEYYVVEPVGQKVVYGNPRKVSE